MPSLLLLLSVQVRPTQKHMADTAQSAPISEKQAQSRRSDRNAQEEGGTAVLPKYDTCEVRLSFQGYHTSL
ncbi:hypothetical protein DVH05_011423 [Phytophthora capsici]|nr:hypothetical protein DVH05_011423 [Phytophthora capsici]